MHSFLSYYRDPTNSDKYVNKPKDCNASKTKVEIPNTIY